MSFYSVGHALTVSAERYPHRIAIDFMGESLSYATLLRRVNCLANNLRSLGIGRGDRVGYIFPNCMQIVELYFATQKIGAVAVPLNHRLTYAELKHLLSVSECAALAYDRSYGGMVEKLKYESQCPRILVGSEDPESGDHSFEQLRSEGSTAEPGTLVGPGDLSRIQHTGGTTGLPKGVMRAHGAELFQVMSLLIQSKMGASADEVIFNQSPLHHQGGMIWLLGSIFTGSRMVIGSSFDPVKIFEEIDKKGVTYLNILPPSAYLRLLEMPEFKNYDLSSVKMVNTGAGLSSEGIVKKIFALFPNCEINYGWGQTETGVGTNNILSRTDFDRDRFISIGRAAPLIELRLVDEQGRSVGTGEMGECIARGPTIMTGYYNQPELTAAVYRDGWVHTGDMLRKDRDGFYYMVCRKKEMIKSGGENVFAQEVEEVIQRHPAVRGCAIIGVPDEHLGEAVAAIVELKPGCALTEAELQEHCKRVISSYKKPRVVLFVDTLPMDSTGKVRKKELVTIYREYRLKAEERPAELR